MMRAILRDLFSGKDNQSLDIGRVIWAGSAGALALLEAHAVVLLHQPFDPIQFATACAAIMAAGGGALAFKAKTEPGS